MNFAPSHFFAVVLFATFASVVFGITQRATPRGMVLYGARCWAGLLAVVIVASWVMFLIRH